MENNIKKSNVFNLIILDESGSMFSIEREALSGCNETIQSIRSIQSNYEETQTHYVSLITFNASNDQHVVFDKAPVMEARELAPSDYNPNDCTPLYDAMGKALTNLKITMPHEDGVTNNVLVTIITDGYENSSTRYDSKKIKSLVEELKNMGWSFSYIGANQDVLSVSRDLSIDNCLSFKADSRGTKQVFRCATNSMIAFCSSISKGAKGSQKLNYDEK